jgi:hypothetical protein
MPRSKKIKVEERKTEQLMEKKIEKKTEEPKKKFSVKLIFGLMLFVFFIGAIGFGGYFYFQYKKVLKNSSVGAQSETKALTEKIGKFVDLPTDEDPTIAEVKDTEKLKGQIFFSSAQNGDKVLIYSKKKKAVLYRPETNKVIEVTSLSAKSENEVAEPEPEKQNTIAQSAQVEKITENESVQEKVETDIRPATADESFQSKKIIVYNGTKAKGLAAELGARILSEMPEVEIVKVGNAVGNYPETIIIDLFGNNSELVRKIIETIGGEAGVLPEGEIKPAGDILVIGGEK